MIRKLKHRYRKWRDWCKYINRTSTWYKILVFLGIKKNRWFDSWRFYEDET